MGSRAGGWKVYPTCAAEAIKHREVAEDAPSLGSTGLPITDQLQRGKRGREEVHEMLLAIQKSDLTLTPQPKHPFIPFSIPLSRLSMTPETRALKA